MGKENENYRGWSNYATWAFYMLLTYDAESCADWLKQVERIRKEVAATWNVGHGTLSRSEAELFTLRDHLKAKVTLGLLLGDSTQLLPAAERVNWEEIAAAIRSGRMEPRPALFSPGRQVVTPEAVRALQPLDAVVSLIRHVRGDWGELCKEDLEANERGLLEGGRLFSLYHAEDKTKFYIITEHDRSVTTVLLPEDY